MTIRVALVDDQDSTHDAIAALLRSSSDISLVGQVYRGEDALPLCHNVRPDLLIMDVLLPGISGPQATRAVVAEYPAMRVLALSSYDDHERIHAMIEAGACGYVVKDAIASDLLDILRATQSGHMVLSPSAARALISPPPAESRDLFRLTERERSVLSALARGLTNQQIALELAISEATVRFHLGNVLAKMNVETRSEALVLAARLNLV